ncbi:MAG: hypothetical protein JKY08_07780 [Flavobacteriaceae bacterium]|nr:hypothetical protein [Flavobacteriaceae bacterium]
MKKYLNQSIFLLFVVFIILISCSPQSKESYIEEYQKFILNVRNDCGNYSEEDWLKTNKKFIKFSEDWYENFENEFIWSEILILSKYEVEYNLLKFKNEFSAITEIFKKENFKNLKEQIKYYSENNMGEDIEFLKKQADSIGESAVKMLDDILSKKEKAD